MNKKFKKENKITYTVRFIDKDKTIGKDYNYSEYIGNLINDKTKSYIIIDNCFGQHKILREQIIKIYKYGDTTL